MIWDLQRSACAIGVRRWVEGQGILEANDWMLREPGGGMHAEGTRFPAADA